MDDSERYKQKVEQIGHYSLEMVEDRAKSLLRTTELHFKNRTDILKSLFNLILAALGGILTIITVNANSPGLIRNPCLIFIGTSILFFTGIYIFISLKYYGVYLEDVNLKVNSKRVQVITAVQNLMMNREDQKALGNLFDTLKTLEEVEVDGMKNIYEFSDTYAGIAVTVGIIFSAFSLILR